MYLDYFGLEKTPFKITPDPNLFFPGAERGATLEALLFAVNRGEGITKVVGEVGSGKTMLCRMVAYRLEGEADVIYIANPSIGPNNILHVIAKELALPIEFSTDKAQVLHCITEHLVKRHTYNRRVLVLVEEAQSMPIATLEEIRFLSNLETDEDKLLQIILFGQPELDVKLNDPSIRQLRERIATSIYLKEFQVDEIHEYLNHRMYRAGYRGPDVFSGKAASAILGPSQGLVRRVNILADKTLMVAYAEKRKKVKERDVRLASGESEFSRSAFPFRQQLFYAAFATGIIISFIVGMGLTKWLVRTDISENNTLIEANPPESIGARAVDDGVRKVVEKER